MSNPSMRKISPPHKAAFEATRYILDFPRIRDNVRSVYAIWWTVKHPERNPNDVDLNFFIHDDSFEFLVAFANAIREAESLLGKTIDTNVITDREMRFVNSGLYLHKFRHALLLMELRNFPAKTYGEDVIDDYRPSDGEIFLETFKIVQLLAYRIKKDLLAKTRDSQKTFSQLRKFTFYSLEYVLASYGEYLHPKNYELAGEIFLRIVAKDMRIAELWKCHEFLELFMKSGEITPENGYEVLQISCEFMTKRLELLIEASKIHESERFWSFMEEHFLRWAYVENPVRWKELSNYVFQSRKWISPKGTPSL